MTAVAGIIPVQSLEPEGRIFALRLRQGVKSQSEFNIVK